MSVISQEEYFGYSTLTIYPMWPWINHPTAASQHVVRIGDGVYTGPEALEPELPYPMRLEAQFLPEADPANRIIRPTPAGLARRRKELACAEIERQKIRKNFSGAGPSLQQIPTPVALFRAKGAPFNYCGVSVSVVALSPIGDSKGAAVALDEVERSHAYVHVLMLRGQDKPEFGREELIARRVGSISPTSRPSSDRD